MAFSFRSILFLIPLYIAFFASGASSLIAEVTWNRMLIVVVGNSMSAAAMIISIFMGGLGLGSYVGGRYFGKRKPTLVPYILLELTIGVYVLLSPVLFDFFAGFFTSLAESVENRSILTLVRLVVSSGALLLPAFLMGVTFPAIIHGAAHHSPLRRTGRTGYLYSTNTVGAAIGCFAAGYHLLLEFGVQLTLTVAFGLYMLAALSALMAKLAGGRGAAKIPKEATEAAPSARDPGLRRFLYAATFGIGFVALAYEVLLTRLSILYLGNSVSVFPLVLTAFLLGTGISAVLGTGLYGALRRRRKGGNRLFGITALLAGVFVLVIPYILLTDRIVSSGEYARFGDAAPRNPFPILGVIILPTILIGGLLPLAIRMLRPEGRGEATREAATLYTLNTAGGLIGAGIANHYLVPAIGIQGALLSLTAVCAAVGLYQLVGAGRGLPRLAAAGAMIVILVALLAAVLPDMMHLYAGKIAKGTRAEAVEVLLVREGRAATVTVLDQKDPRKGSYRDMYLNGVEEASTRYWHAQLFKLLGIFPVLVHESEGPKDVMVIAFGAGITAGSVLASDEVGSLDVVDLNPDIEGINDLFTEVNGDVYHEPRFHFHNDDGRNYLVTTHRRYDLIIGDSTHPRAYDSWILYTREFYESAKKRLKPGGVFAQWVPVLGSMQGELMRIHLNTFRTVFPHTTVWYIYGSDQAFLMATPEPLAIDANRLEAKLRRLPGWFRAEEYQIDTVARIGGFFWMDEAAMERMIGLETRINTDGVHYFDKQSAIWPAPPHLRLPSFQTSVLPYLSPMNGELREAVRAEQAVALSLARYGFFNQKADLYRAYCAMPENGNARYFMGLDQAGAPPDPDVFCRDEEVRRYRAILADYPDDVMTLNALADRLAEAGKLEEALALARRAIDREPRNGMFLDTYGWILHYQGKEGEALEALNRSLAALPDHPIVLYHLAAVHESMGDGPRAKGYAERALRGGGDFPYAAEARELLRRLGG
ncbi:MAG: fused MFS/spermidine synthase [Candidatus Eisenbacteria bacterium]